MLDWTISYPDGRAPKNMAQLSLYELNVVEMMVLNGIASIDHTNGPDAGKAAALERIALERQIRRRAP